MNSILIVEDDKWLAEQFVRLLDKAGYKTNYALNAFDAIEAVDDALPDLIILDILLTGTTAFAFLNELQSYSDTGQIPIILCTSLASELSLEKLMPYGVKQILDKTVMVPEDLITAIRRVLS